MKTLKFSLLVMMVIFTLNVEGALTKRVYRSYPVNKIQKLQVSNKYGHIYIDDNRKDSVVVDVKIWVEGNNERSQKLLDKINATINLEGNTIIAQTTVEMLSNNLKEFNIDYHISIPQDKDLAVEQKYGTVTMKNLTGKGTFNIGYGELTAARLLSPSLKMDISYSKANVEETGDLNLDLKYSKFFLDKGADLKSQTRYSEFNAGEMKIVDTDSKYDQYKIDKLSILKMNSMYSTTRIDRLSTKLDMDNGYGNLRIENIPAGFESIHLTNKYAGVKLGIASNASYKLDGKVRYCDLKHPQSNQLSASRGMTSYSVNGIVGSNADPKSTITIESSYGSVNLVP
jgi:hypothetical protein